MTRAEALKGLTERIVAFYVSPYTGDWIPNLAAHRSVGAEKLEYLPDTKRSFRATMPFSRNYRVCREGSRLDRRRRTNSMTFARFPMVFSIAFQVFGIGSTGPLYYFLHYIQSPLS
jgi:hypothetical protein